MRIRRARDIAIIIKYRKWSGSDRGFVPLFFVGWRKFFVGLIKSKAKHHQLIRRNKVYGINRPIYYAINPLILDLSHKI